MDIRNYILENYQEVEINEEFTLTDEMKKVICYDLDLDLISFEILLNYFSDENTGHPYENNIIPLFRYYSIIDDEIGIYRLTILHNQETEIEMINNQLAKVNL